MSQKATLSGGPLDGEALENLQTDQVLIYLAFGVRGRLAQYQRYSDGSWRFVRTADEKTVRAQQRGHRRRA